MKTTAKIIALIFTLSLSGKISAQSSTDMYGVIPHSPASRGGWGFGINMLSRQLTLGDKENPNHIEVRFGGGYYFSNLMRKTVNNVPVSPLENTYGKVTVNNNLFGINTMARFSLPYSKKIIPYFDIFAGLRDFSSNLDILAYNQPYGYQRQTSQQVYDMAEFNYGASFGVMASLGKSFKVDLGVSYSESNHIGNMVNVDSAHLEGNNLVMDKTPAPQNMLLIKVGLVFSFGGGGCHSSNCGRTVYGSPYRSYSPYHSSGHFSGGCSGHVSVHIH